MATPIIQSVGASSGAGTPGEGRNNLVAGERVDLSDTEAANAGASYFWEFQDVPIGTAPTIINPTTATPHFFVDADTYLAGSYVPKCTVNGLDQSLEILSKPLDFTGGRIPFFREELQYDAGGNAKGWHEARTFEMRALDEALGSQGSTVERSGSVAVPVGASSKTLQLGRITYPGSALGLSAVIDEAITGGSVVVTLKVAGSPVLSVTLVAGTPGDDDTEVAGVHLIGNGDNVTIDVVGTAHANASSTASGVAINVTLSNDITSTPLSIPDASMMVKGVTKVSVAPVSATNPIAVGNNDTRVPTQDENDALVGTDGTPNSGNKFVTDSDPRNTDARTPVAHVSTHNPGGGDAIATAVAGAILIGDAAAEGAAASVARSDHKHSLAAPAAPANVTKAAASAGAATAPARADHKHDVSTAAPTGSVFIGASAAEGAAVTLARSDHTHQVFTPGAPVNVDKSAALAGTFTTMARSNHKHDVSTAAPATGIGGANSEGVATTLARSDHNHALRTTTGPTDLSIGAIADGQSLIRSGATIIGADGLSNLRTKFFNIAGNAATAVGDYNTVSIGANASVNISFGFPVDFVTLTKLQIVGIPVSGFASQDIDLTSDYGAIGELYNNHSQADTTSLYSGSANTLFAINAAPLFTSAAALDFAGIMLKHNSIGTTIRYIGIRMEYTV